MTPEQKAIIPHIQEHLRMAKRLADKAGLSVSDDIAEAQSTCKLLLSHVCPEAELAAEMAAAA